jgi:DNA-binding NarL/FixJ family response regulator
MRCLAILSTISSYRARIMDKMQMKSNDELTRYAMTHNLID